MTSCAAVPTRRSLRLVPTIVALCPKQVCEAAAPDAPKNARPLKRAAPTARNLTTAAMAQASASLAERSVTAKGYFAHASCRRTGRRGSMTMLRRGRGWVASSVPAGSERSRFSMVARNEVRRTGPGSSDGRAAPSATEWTRLSTAVRTPCEHRAGRLRPSEARRVANIRMKNGCAGHSMTHQDTAPSLVMKGSPVRVRASALSIAGCFRIAIVRPPDRANTARTPRLVEHHYFRLEL
jgi:hypothetical protein